MPYPVNPHSRRVVNGHGDPPPGRQEVLRSIEVALSYDEDGEVEDPRVDLDLFRQSPQRVMGALDLVAPQCAGHHPHIHADLAQQIQFIDHEQMRVGMPDLQS